MSFDPVICGPRNLVDMRLGALDDIAEVGLARIMHESSPYFVLKKGDHFISHSPAGAEATTFKDARPAGLFLVERYGIKLDMVDVRYADRAAFERRQAQGYMF
jgi:hypothetical protein